MLISIYGTEVRLSSHFSSCFAREGNGYDIEQVIGQAELPAVCVAKALSGCPSKRLCHARGITVKREG